MPQHAPNEALPGTRLACAATIRRFARRGVFATNSPQAEKVRAGQWRISAGFNGSKICGKSEDFKEEGVSYD